MMETESVMDIVKRNERRWLNHVLKDENDLVREVIEMNAEKNKGRGRHTQKEMAWQKMMGEEMRIKGFVRKDIKNRAKWGITSEGPARLVTYLSREMALYCSHRIIV